MTELKLQRGDKSKSVVWLAKKSQQRRQRITNLLWEWGARFQVVGEEYSYTKSVHGVDFAGVGVSGGGYDVCHWSDFDSLMFELSGHIENLEPHKRNLIEREFMRPSQGNSLEWAKQWERSEASYKSTKSRLVLKLALSMGF